MQIRLIALLVLVISSFKVNAQQLYFYLNADSHAGAAAICQRAADQGRGWS